MYTKDLLPKISLAILKRNLLLHDLIIMAPKESFIYEFLVNWSRFQHFSCRYGCSPVALFEAPVEKKCPQDYVDIMVFIDFMLLIELFM